MSTGQRGIPERRSLLRTDGCFAILTVGAIHHLLLDFADAREILGVHREWKGDYAMAKILIVEDEKNNLQKI